MVDKLKNRAKYRAQLLRRKGWYPDTPRLMSSKKKKNALREKHDQEDAALDITLPSDYESDVEEAEPSDLLEYFPYPDYTPKLQAIFDNFVQSEKEHAIQVKKNNKLFREEQVKEKRKMRTQNKKKTKKARK